VSGPIAGYPGGSKSFQRVANLALVMNIIRREQPMSRTSIARRLGLDRSTITHITSRLLDEGCVRVDSEGDATKRGGRRPTLLAINPDWGYTLGIDLTPGDCRAVAMNLSGDLLWSGGDPLSGYADNPSRAVLAAVSRLLRSAEASVQAASRKVSRSPALLGLGIAVPGVVEPATGRVIHSRALGLDEYDLLTRVTERTGLPTIVENDARCCAYGELMGDHESFLFVLGRFQPEVGAEHRLLKRSGMGVGIGLAIDGRVHTGAHHAAGEFRSIHWKSGYPGQLGLEPDVLPRLQTDSTVLRRVIAEVMANLIPVISVVDPSAVVLGGEFRRHISVVETVLSGELAGSFAANETATWEFRSSRHGDSEVAAGAAWMFIERLFSVPLPAGATADAEWDRVFQRAAVAERSA